MKIASWDFKSGRMLFSFHDSSFCPARSAEFFNPCVEKSSLSVRHPSGCNPKSVAVLTTFVQKAVNKIDHLKENQMIHFSKKECASKARIFVGN